jgi:hypothetical protein
MPFMSSIRRLALVLALAAALVLGATSPALAAGRATHTGNCGKFTSQTHTTPHRTTWMKTCPSKPHHPAHPVHPTTPSSQAASSSTAPGLHVRTTTPGWSKRLK